MSRGPILAIAGQPGAGKTTLSRALADRLGWRLVSYDDFETHTRLPPDAISDWLARGAPYDEIATPGLSDALNTSAKGTVFDTPLGRAHPATGALIDALVVIRCAPEIALARKIAQLTQAVPEEEAMGFVHWLTGYLAAYESIVRPAIAVQETRLQIGCDLEINATEGTTAQLETIMRFFPHWFPGIDSPPIPLP